VIFADRIYYDKDEEVKEVKPPPPREDPKPNREMTAEGG
jgi:hypothetical protein